MLLVTNCLWVASIQVRNWCRLPWKSLHKCSPSWQGMVWVSGLCIFLVKEPTSCRSKTKAHGPIIFRCVAIEFFQHELESLNPVQSCTAMRTIVTWSHWAIPFLFKIFIYLALLSLSFGMWNIIPWPGLEPGASALRVCSLSHWSTREASPSSF